MTRKPHIRIVVVNDGPVALSGARGAHPRPDSDSAPSLAPAHEVYWGTKDDNTRSSWKCVVTV